MEGWNLHRSLEVLGKGRSNTQSAIDLAHDLLDMVGTNPLNLAGYQDSLELSPGPELATFQEAIILIQFTCGTINFAIPQ